MTTCAQCGASVNGKFCAGCGAPVAVAPPAPDPPAAPATELSIVARPEGAEGVVHLHSEPIATGSQVTVGADEVFVAIKGGVIGMLGPGRHAMPQAVDGGAFVNGTVHEYRVTHPIELGDQSARIFGTVRFAVQDPAKFIASVDPKVVDGDGLEGAVVEAAGKMVETVVKEAFGAKKTLEQIEAQFATLIAPLAKQWPVTGTGIELLDLALSTGAAEEEDEESDEDESLVGEEVFVTISKGKRAKAVVEASGWRVRFEDGRIAWFEDSAIELE